MTTGTTTEQTMSDQNSPDGRVNGVDVPTPFATIDAVRAQPEPAAFRFRAASEWVSGTHGRGRFPGFFGAGQEHVHATPGADDVRGILGIDDTVRNGFSEIRVVFEVDGDADAERLAALVGQSQARSAVFDVITQGTDVSVEVTTR